MHYPRNLQQAVLDRLLRLRFGRLHLHLLDDTQRKEGLFLGKRDRRVLCADIALHNPNWLDLRALLEQCFLALFEVLHALVALLLLLVDFTSFTLRVGIFVLDDETLLDQ